MGTAGRPSIPAVPLVPAAACAYYREHMRDSGPTPGGVAVRRNVAVPVPLLALTLLAGCGASRSVSYTAAIDLPGDVFTCVQTATSEADFVVEFRDERQRRLVVSRTNEDLQRSDPNFQKAVDQLTVDVGPSDAVSDPRLRVTARTYFEYWDRRGRTRRQHETSADARTAAQRLLELCGPGPEVGAV